MLGSSQCFQVTSGDVSGSSVDSGGDEVGNGSSRHHDLDGFFPCLGDRESQIWTIENATENRVGGG